MSKQAILWYISGPMTGIRDFNRNEFYAAEKEIKDRFYADEWQHVKFFNPAWHDEYEKGISLVSEKGDPADIGLTQESLIEIIDKDIAEVKKADCVYMLRGWEKSKGARAEHALAEWLGKRIEYQYVGYVHLDEPKEKNNLSLPDDNPKTAEGFKKVPMHLVPPIMIAQVAMAFMDGARKYGPYNWREQKISSSTYYAACKRHLDSWWDGEDLAEDSGESHLGHAAACLAMIMDSEAIGKLNDDRPPKGGMASFLKGKQK